MDTLIMAGQLMLSLSILIVLHEMGHFFPARWFKTRVEKFYLFFDPWFSLFKIKRGDTEYGIGWLPLGGYVKISGMIDESFDKEQMKQPPKPWEFRSKPAWQRLIIMLGGVTVNFILGFLLFGMVLFFWGEQYLPSENVEYGIHVDSLGMELGLQEGDKIVSVGGVPFKEFNDRIIVKEIVINNAKTVTVRRDGKEVDVPVPPDFTNELASFKNKNKSLFWVPYPFVISNVAEDMPAAKAGIKAEDQIIAFNGTPTPFAIDVVKETQENRCQPVELTVLRDKKDTMNFNLTITNKGTMGVYFKDISAFYEIATEKYSFVESIPEGFKRGSAFLVDQWKAFGRMFSGEIKASESLGGFGTIGSMFGNVWDWQRFWRMTAILSLILAFMNLLPIPALDGGHVMFLLYEVVTGRKPSDKFMEYATMIGFIIVLGLVLYANGLDAIRYIFNRGGDGGGIDC